MTIEAVVALKTLAQSKRRLSAVLSDEQRCDLVEAMAQDVLSCLLGHPEIDTVHAVCGEGWGRSVFPEGALVMWEEGESREGGLIAAYEMVAAKTAAERLLFIHADLPFLGQEDISAVIAASLDDHAVLSSDLTETGTNAVLRWRHQSLPLCFGEDSFARHQQAARATGTPWRVVRANGVARDVDEPEDLDRLGDDDPNLGKATARWSAVADIKVSMSATHRAG
ncbi:MAG: 2-phospho-L-lactate guanylyltransferase [Gammaproteobacteria bacterium]|nr:2-phospho-L-lactate guanylyltransferase [Gammaproteobacteria bacterium]